MLELVSACVCDYIEQSPVASSPIDYLKDMNYEMSDNRTSARGTVFVVNITEFTYGYEMRYGTDTDLRGLGGSFQNFGFNIVSRHNSSSLELTRDLEYG